jgi:Phosphotransferase enzyme family
MTPSPHRPQSRNLPTGDPEVEASNPAGLVADVEYVRYLLEGWRSPGMGVVKSVMLVQDNAYASRTSSQIVDVLTSDGRPERLLLKAGKVGERTRAGSPWGADYEAAMYSGALARIPSFASPFLGHLVDGGRLWLVLRWINDALSVAKSPHPSGIRAAATWLGRFHDEASVLLDLSGPQELNRYSHGIVVAWADLASANLRQTFSDELPVLRALRKAAPEAQFLLGTHQTLVHGDLYPPNVLITGSAVIPVDWEWAGAGAGELDLAALVDGWPDSTSSACIADYQRTRWSSGRVQDFAERFAAARLFLAVRWLGGHPLHADDPATDYHVRHLGEALHSLGFGPVGEAVLGAP